MPLDALPTEEVSACALHPRVAGLPDAATGGALGLPPAYGVLACPRCGLRWLSPRPTAAGYRELYSYDSYFDAGGAPEPYRETVARRLWGFRRRLRRLESLCGRPSLRILDVGAATGEFVVQARAQGHRAAGYEPSDGARAEAHRRHGVELADGALEDLDGPYDVVHLSHVFEHLPDPLAALRTISRQIVEDGVLVIEVPQQLGNDVERLKRLLGRGRDGRFDAFSLHHTYFYTPPTLIAMLAAGGFEAFEVRTAHWGLTPPVPFSLRNLLLGVLIQLSDRVHRGGPVIEAYARPAAAG